ncbi:hypothetical protein MMC22_011697 [Lobaria immixta]|nr:hypothetical protein [Lobaria immixta]
MAASLVQTIVPIPGLTTPLGYEYLQAAHDLPTKTSNVGFTKIYGRIFEYVGADCPIAYEYEPGSVTDLSTVSENFFKDLIDCVCTLGLQDVLGLQVLGRSTDSMVKFGLTQLETVIMEGQDAQHGENFRATGWTLHTGDDWNSVIQGRANHTRKQLKGHTR